MKENLFLKSIFALFCLTAVGYAQDPTPTPKIVGEVTVTATKANSDPVYTEFRKLSQNPNSFSGDYATVNNLQIKRDAATFTLRSGEIYFLTPAEGKTTGAVFFGDGEISLTPPVDAEKKMMNFFTGSSDFKEQFSQLVIFFTDQTFNEVKNSSNVKMSANGSQASRARDAFRDKEDLLKVHFHYNMTTRILLDAYAPPRPGFFTSFIEGKKYSKLIYQLDPLGIEEVSPEQVMLMNYSDIDEGIWSAFHLNDEYKKGTAKSSTDRRIFDITNHTIDITVRGTKLFASDKITLNNLVPGQRVLPFNLYPSLRVKKVSGENGEELNIIQEDKNKDGGLAVILPAAPEVGKPLILNFEYEGEEALRQAGTGNFILIPRESWYPNNGGTQFGDRATFDITFRYPKQFVMVGVGELVEPEKIDGDLKIAHWSTKGVEMTVAGFNYGDFIKKEYTDKQTGNVIEVYNNRELPDDIKDYVRQVQEAQEQGATITATLGALTTSGMTDNMMSQAQNSVKIYNAYFGKLPHKRIAMTQQPAGNFGQAWATLVFMPFTAYFDQTTRTQLFGIQGGNNIFWREVAPHEISHQWWGHAVGWTSYHDQWMSEGFAQLSASLYIQYVQKDLDKFNDFWDEQRRRIVEETAATKNLKPYTVGPVTQGYRLNTGKTGAIAQNLIYPKGAYILHMIRMMMYDGKTKDQRFREMMKDFIASHYNKDVSTEDFKAIVEKHITPEMDIDKNGKMDWFFDEWVYGTEVPAYKLEYSITKSGDQSILNATLTQSGVSDNFVMPVPIYVDFGQGPVPLATVTMVGSKSFDLTNVPLPQSPKKVTIAALSEVLMTKLDVVKK